MLTPDEIAPRILSAHRLLTSGYGSAAEQLLSTLLPYVEEARYSPGVFAIRRMLGQCARIEKRFDDAREHY